MTISASSADSSGDCSAAAATADLTVLNMPMEEPMSATNEIGSEEEILQVLLKGFLQQWALKNQIPNTALDVLCYRVRVLQKLDKTSSSHCRGKSSLPMQKLTRSFFTLPTNV